MVGRISGKSDFEDFCEMHHTPEEVIKNYKVFVGNHTIVPLRMESKKDLVAYYPYCMSLMSKDENGGIVILQDKPFLDYEEQEHLSWKMDSVQKYWRKCKRKKVPFDRNKALSLIAFPYDDPRSDEIELVNRVSELGDKATTEDIHDRYHDNRRKEWLELMVDNGWDENVAYKWIFGWKRFLEKLDGRDFW